MATGDRSTIGACFDGATMSLVVDSMVVSIPSPATEGDLLRMPADGRKYELVDGEIRVSPAGARHGLVCVRLVLRLGGFVEERRLGHVFDSSTGFRLPGGNVRSPDVSFVKLGRFPEERISEDFSDVVPDLAVEVLSPEDRSRDILDKVGDYLQAGVRLIWVVDPKRQTAVAYESLTAVSAIALDEALDGKDVVPGFRAILRDLVV